jgi:hypothetical protein
MNPEQFTISCVVELEVGNWIINFKFDVGSHWQPSEIDSSSMLNIVGLTQNKWKVPLDLEKDIRPITWLRVRVIQGIRNS